MMDSILAKLEYEKPSLASLVIPQGVVEGAGGTPGPEALNAGDDGKTEEIVGEDDLN